MTLCTVIGAELGEKAFGAACARAEVWLTLRAEHNADLDALRTAVLGCAKALAEEAALDFSFEEQDVFPATENTPACAEKVCSLCHGKTLEAPCVGVKILVATSCMSPARFSASVREKPTPRCTRKITNTPTACWTRPQTHSGQGFGRIKRHMYPIGYHRIRIGFP